MLEESSPVKTEAIATLAHSALGIHYNFISEKYVFSIRIRFVPFFSFNCVPPRLELCVWKSQSEIYSNLFHLEMNIIRSDVCHRNNNKPIKPQSTSQSAECTYGDDLIRKELEFNWIERGSNVLRFNSFHLFRIRIVSLWCAPVGLLFVTPHKCGRNSRIPFFFYSWFVVDVYGRSERKPISLSLTLSSSLHRHLARCRCK